MKVVSLQLEKCTTHESEKRGFLHPISTLTPVYLHPNSTPMGDGRGKAEGCKGGLKQSAESLRR